MTPEQLARLKRKGIAKPKEQPKVPEEPKKEKKEEDYSKYLMMIINELSKLSSKETNVSISNTESKPKRLTINRDSKGLIQTIDIS